jgi:outer membrane murein-binding lipoprotein Lpp
MLDCLHSSGIEIASPNLMMTRQWSEDHKLIPKAVLRSDSTDPAGGVDREVFDIAEAAGRVEELKTEIISVEEQLKQLAREAGAAAGDADREKIEKHKGVLERKLQRLKEAVSVAEQSLVREEG